MLNLQDLTGLPRDLVRIVLGYSELDWILFRTRNILKFYPSHNIECHQAVYLSSDDREITLFDTKLKALLTWKLYDNREELIRMIPWSDISPQNSVKSFEMSQDFQILAISETKVYAIEGYYLRTYMLNEKRMLQNDMISKGLIKRTFTWSVGNKTPTLWYAWQNWPTDAYFIYSFENRESIVLRDYSPIEAIAVNETTIYIKTRDKLDIFDRKNRQIISSIPMKSINDSRMMLTEKYLFIFIENLNEDKTEIKICNLKGQIIRPNSSLQGRLIHANKDRILMFHKKEGLMEYRDRIFND